MQSITQKAEVVPATPAEAALADVRALTTEALRDELARSLALTAASLARLAAIVRTLEERGEDLAELRLGLLDYLRRIAYGQLLPEVVVRFGDRPGLLRTVSSLPLPDQRSLAAGEPVPLLVDREGGSTETRLADPLKMRPEQLRQVFGRDRIRDEAEQVLLLEQQRRKPPRRPHRESVGNVAVDRRRGGIVVGKTFLGKVEALEALAALADAGEPRDEGPAENVVAIHLTEREHSALKANAAAAGTSMSALARRAMIVAGLLAGGSP